MNKFFLAGMVIFLFSLCYVSAYSVNQPLTINVKLQYDNGTALQDVVSQACIASVYDGTTSQLVLRDANMTPGAYQTVLFTPADIGTYTISIKCNYGGEEATYFQDFEITMPMSNPPLGGQVLNLNAQIVPDKSSYTVNVQGEPRLSFNVLYSVDSQPTNSHEAEWRLVQGDTVLDKGNFVIQRTGNYLFSYDFKNKQPGDYKVFLYFDGRTEIVDVGVIDLSESATAVTGWAMDSKGNVNPWKVAIASVIGFMLLVLVIGLIWNNRSRRKR